MAEAIAKFEKVSLDEWIKTFSSTAPEGHIVTDKEKEEMTAMYNNIKLPKRSTSGSAGYDFFMPFTSGPIFPGVSASIPTGIKCKIEPGWVLVLAPKSGLGVRYKLRLDNTIGVIDSDYYNCEANEGHIIVFISNELPPQVVENPITRKPEIPKELVLQLPEGKSFVQGIFLPYGTAEEEEITETRTGGFGSTDS